MEMFRFANPEILYLLAIIPILIIVFIFSRIRQKREIEIFGNPQTIQELMPNASPSRRTWKFTIILIAIALLIVALARPQSGAKLEKVQREGVEIIIALDVSNSMMAEDIQPNRLDRAKRAISRLMDRLNDDKIGLIVFAGDAYVQLPITNDYNSAKLFLDAINTDVVPRQGTAIGAAIELAARSFTPAEVANKAIII